METFENVTYRNESVTVDGKRFQGCAFENVTLIFGGNTLPAFVNCRFSGVSLQFDSAASRTLRFLSGLREGGFSQAVDQLFQTVREQKV